MMRDTPLEERITKQWGDLGFQGKDPQTDFRGMGMLWFVSDTWDYYSSAQASQGCHLQTGLKGRISLENRNVYKIYNLNVHESCIVIQMSIIASILWNLEIISRFEGVLTANIFEEKYEPRLEFKFFLRGGGGVKPKTSAWEGYGYFLEYSAHLENGHVNQRRVSF